MGRRAIENMGICNSEDPCNTNKAFLFIKPHAVTEKTKALVKEQLQKKGFEIKGEGEIKAEDIDSKQLIDNHYYAIASKATILKPSELNIPEDKFEAKFGLSWADALAGGRVFNALDACADLEIDAVEMDKQWGIHKKADKLIKFGGGFYCGLITIEGKEPCYVFNGFFMEMRSKYVAAGLSIYYYVVEWDAATMPWTAFRGEGLGATDPAEAPAGAVRAQILAQWETLGLVSQPDVGDNGMHGSASPFEALSELANWTGADVAAEPFGKAMIDAGISAETIKAWSVDPQVTLPGGDAKGSLFDSVEDMDADACLAKLIEVNKANQPTSEASQTVACPEVSKSIVAEEQPASEACETWSWTHAAAAAAVVVVGFFAYRKMK